MKRDASKDSSAEIRETIQRLLDHPIEDEEKVLEVIVDAITSRRVDPAMVEKAVRQAVTNYEVQLRVFSVAAANAQLRKILRLLNSIDDIEEQLEVRSCELEAKDLVRLYASMQSRLNSSLDYVKKVMDMRIEVVQAQAAMLSSQERSEIEALSGLPTLDPSQRDRVRRILEGIAEEITEDIVGMNAGTVALVPSNGSGKK